MWTYGWLRVSKTTTIGFALAALAIGGCKETKETAKDVLGVDVRGEVTDNRGEAVSGVKVKLYNLFENTNFVEGSDITSGEAYIAREAVLASNNSVATATTGADGHFTMAAIPSPFLAVAVKEGCSAGFAGFNEETGVLNTSTLLTPDLTSGFDFDVPGFTLACAAPPEVGPDGNSADAPPFELPPPTITCDAATCTAAGGKCDGDRCSITCDAARCTGAGGTCTNGVCTMTTCDATKCTAEGGKCSPDGKSCLLPACKSDADCRDGQPGAVCVNPGDVALAKCEAPLPGEIVSPPSATGWTGFRITDTSDKLITDASSADQSVPTANLPENGLIRVHADYSGTATTGFVLVQSGGHDCPNASPRTDTIQADIKNGGFATDAGNFVEVPLTGGYQKIQLSTSDVLGQGERSFTIEVGEPCAPPAHAFTAILSWDAGPGQPADLDLDVWNTAGELVFVGNKQAAWGKLAHEGKGPGPEVFESDDPTQGPFTIKVQFFSGKPRNVEGKVRLIRIVGGQVLDDTFAFTVDHPKDVAEIGVFPSQ